MQGPTVGLYFSELLRFVAAYVPKIKSDQFTAHALFLIPNSYQHFLIVRAKAISIFYPEVVALIIDAGCQNQRSTDVPGEKIPNTQTNIFSEVRKDDHFLRITSELGNLRLFNVVIAATICQSQFRYDFAGFEFPHLQNVHVAQVFFVSQGEKPIAGWIAADGVADRDEASGALVAALRIEAPLRKRRSRHAFDCCQERKSVPRHLD